MPGSPSADKVRAIVNIEVTYGFTLAPPGFHRVTTAKSASAKSSAGGGSAESKGDDDAILPAKLSVGVEDSNGEVFLWYKRGAGPPVVSISVLRSDTGETVSAGEGVELVRKGLIRAGKPKCHLGVQRNTEAAVGDTVTAITNVGIVYGASDGSIPSPEELADAGYADYAVVQPALDASGTVWLVNLHEDVAVQVLDTARADQQSELVSPPRRSGSVWSIDVETLQATVAKVNSITAGSGESTALQELVETTLLPFVRKILSSRIVGLSIQEEAGKVLVASADAVGRLFQQLTSPWPASAWELCRLLLDTEKPAQYFYRYYGMHGTLPTADMEKGCVAIAPRGGRYGGMNPMYHGSAYQTPVSKYFGAVLNRSFQSGVFDSWGHATTPARSAPGKSTRKSPVSAFHDISAAATCFNSKKTYFSAEFCTAFIVPKFLKPAFVYLSHLEANELKDLEAEQIYAFLDELKTLGRHCSPGSRMINVDELAELAELNITLDRLAANSLSVRQRGLDMLVELIAMMDQYRYRGRTAKYLTSDQLADSLESANVISQLVGRDESRACEPELLANCAPLLLFLKRQRKLDDAVIDALWSLFEAGTTDIMLAAGEVLGAIAKNLSPEQVQSIIKQLEELPKERVAAAQDLVVAMLRVPAARDLREQYLKNCVLNLIFGTNVGPSLRIATAVLSEIKSTYYTSNRKAIIARLDTYCSYTCERGLARAIVSNIARHKLVLVDTLRQATSGSPASLADGRMADEETAGAESEDEVVMRLSADDVSKVLSTASDAIVSEALAKDSYMDELRTRFAFMQYVLDEGDLSLDYDSVALLWKCCIALCIEPAESNLLLSWLRHTLPRTPTSLTTVLGYPDLSDVFSKLLCGESQRSLRQVSSSAYYSTFCSFFKYCNIKSKKLVDRLTGSGRRLEPLVAPTKLLGYSRLWDLVLHNDDAQSTSAAVDFLIALYMNLSTVLERDCGDLWCEFVRSCVETLEKATSERDEMDGGDADVQTLALLKLLGTFFGRLADRKPPKPAGGAWSGGSMGHVSRPAIPAGHKRLSVWAYRGKVKRAMGRLDFQVVLKNDCTVGELRDAVSEETQHPADQVRIVSRTGDPVDAGFDSLSLDDASVSLAPDVFLLEAPEGDTRGHKCKSSESFGDEHADSDTAHHNWKGSAAGWAGFRKLSWDAKDPRWMPVKLLAHSKGNFDMLYRLLKRGNSNSVVEQVWSLLQTLPANDDLAQGMRDALEDADRGDAHWSELLDSDSPATLLYSLCVLEGIVADAVSGVVRREAVSTFIAGAGFSRLQRHFVVETPETQLYSTALARASTSVLMRILCVAIPMVESTQLLDGLAGKVMLALNGALASPVEHLEATHVTSADGDSSRRSVEAELVRWAFNVLAQLCRITPRLLDEHVLIDDGSAVESVLFNGLLGARHASVRDSVMHGYEHLCNSVAGFSLSQSPDERAVNIMLQGLTSVYAHSDRSAQFFDLLRKLVGGCVRKGVLDAPSLCLRLVRTIRAHTPVEQTAEDNDFVFRGLLSVTAALFDRSIGKVAAVRKEAAALVPHLVFVGLFGTPPMAKHAETRQQVYALLLALAQGSSSSCSLLLHLLAGQHFAGDGGSGFGAVDDAWKISAMDDEAKSKSGYVGIRNLGCICYMNSLLQQFFTIEGFRDGILNYEFDESHDPTADDAAGLMLQLQRLYAGLQLSQQQYVDPSDFCAAYKDMDGAAVDVTVQQDASEFLTQFFQQIESVMSGTPSEGLLRSCFGARLMNRLDSTDGTQHSERVEFFTFISVVVEGMHDLHRALEDYVKPEPVEYTWPKVGALSTEKRVCLHTLPKHFIIHLRRFAMDMTTLNTVKVNDHFEFPLELDLHPYTSAGLAGDDSEREQCQYRLSGVVIHVGTANSGHYYSLIRDRSCKAEAWLEFNDRVVKPFDIETLGDEAFGGEDVLRQEHAYSSRTSSSTVERIKNAFMLVYDKVEPSSTKLSATKALAQPIESDSAGPYSEVQALNKVFWRRRHLLSADYDRFAERLMAAQETIAAPVVRRNVAGSLPAANVGDSDVEEYSSEPGVDLSGLDGSIRQVAATLPCRKAVFGTRYLLGTLARLENKDRFNKFVPLLARPLLGDAAAAEWFVRFVCTGCDGNVLSIYTADDVPGAVTVGLMSLLVKAISSLLRLSPPSAVATIDQCVEKLCMLLPEMMCRSTRLRFIETLRGIAALGVPTSNALAKCGVPGAFAKLCAASIETEANAWLAAVQAHLKGAATVQRPPPTSRAKQLARADVTSSLLTLSQILSHVPPLQSDDSISACERAGTVALPTADRRALLASDFLEFLVLAVGDEKNRSRAAVARHIVCHLSFESPVGTAAIVDAIVTELDRSDGEDLKAPFWASRAVCRLQDSLASTRLDQLLRRTLNTLEVNTRFEQATAASLERLMKLARRERNVETWLRDHPDTWEWATKWIGDNVGSSVRGGPYKAGYNYTSARLRTPVDRKPVFKFFKSIASPDVLVDRSEHEEYSSENEAEELLGARVSIRWKSGTRVSWYEGSVTEIRARSDEHKVVYDDGEIKFYQFRTFAPWKIIMGGQGLGLPPCRSCGVHVS